MLDKVQLAARQNVWLSSVHVLPSSWLPSHNDPSVIAPWSEAFSIMGPRLALLSVRRGIRDDGSTSAGARDTAVRPVRARVLGDLGWHSTALHSAITGSLGRLPSPGESDPSEEGSEAALVRVESVHCDRLSFSLARAVIRANANGPSQSRARVASIMSPAHAPRTGSAADAAGLKKTLDKVCREAVRDGIDPCDTSLSLVSNGSDDLLECDPHPDDDADDADDDDDVTIRLLVCVDTCTSRLSLQQMASQLQQVGFVSFLKSHITCHVYAS